MKKKIAIFANGLNGENLMKYMAGIKETCGDNFADFHVFLSHDSFGSTDEINKAEHCIYDLPDLKKYDGAILFGPGLNFEEVNTSIVNRCHEANIPLICISSKYDNSIRIYTDNYEGMKVLAEHIINEHDVKDVLFIAGPKDNYESNERLRAVKDAFISRNLPFNDNNVFYANWVAYLATDFVKKMCLSKKGLPDAIICANDVTAYFICFILNDLGLSCPKDVLVTGFDGNNQAMNFYPAITTVVQPFYEMGVKTVECFVDIFAGNKLDHEYYIPCGFREGESCGCNTSKKYDEHRRYSCVETYKQSIVDDLHLYHIKGLTDAVLKSENYSTIARCLQQFFYESDGVEGNPFYICIDPEFARLNEFDVSALPSYKYTNYFYMLVGKNGDNKHDTIKYDISEGLIPFEIEDQINHMYVFQPIYHKTFVCGYMIMADNIEYFGAKKYHFMHTQFNRLLDQYKKNMQLTYLNTKLSQIINTDILTSTKNRTAFETYKVSLSDDITSGYIKNVAFVVADINSLKYINDNFGHDHGDKYIKNASSLICTTFKHSPVFRIGGDEFLVVLTGEDYENRSALCDKMGNTMLDLAKNESNPILRISIAFGIADYDNSTDKNLDATIKRADDMMYENKRKYKNVIL